MTKHRSRRLRKKLRLAEFQELGFLVEVGFRHDLAVEEADRYLDALLSELIEPRGLAYGGGTQSGFIARYGRGSASEADREAVTRWLRARQEVAHVHAGPLVDAWYHDADLETQAPHASA